MQFETDPVNLAEVAQQNRCLGLAVQTVTSPKGVTKTFVWHLKQAIVEPLDEAHETIPPELYAVAEVAYRSKRLSPLCMGSGTSVEAAVRDYLDQKHSSEWVCPFVFLDGHGTVRPLRMPYRWNGDSYVDLTVEECANRGLWPAGCRVPGGMSPAEFWASVSTDTFAWDRYEGLLTHGLNGGG